MDRSFPEGADTMKKMIAFLKKEPMLTVSVAAAVLSLFFTPPSAALL